MSNQNFGPQLRILDVSVSSGSQNAHHDGIEISDPLVLVAAFGVVGDDINDTRISMAKDVLA